MNFNIMAEGDFLFHNFCCALPKDTIDIEVTIQTVDGIHTYRRDRMTQAASYRAWSRQVRPFPSLRKKIAEYQEEKRRPFNIFTPVREAHFARRVREVGDPRRVESVGSWTWDIICPPVWCLHAQQLPQQTCLFLPTHHAFLMCQLYPSHQPKHVALPQNHLHKHCVIYVYPRENCALLLPQVPNGQTIIGMERETEKE